MRMAFGLAGLLVTLGVVVLIMKYFYLPDVQASQHAQQYAHDIIDPISGRDANGDDIETTYSVFVESRDDGKLKDFQVTVVKPGGGMDRNFGLKSGDVIIAAIDTHMVRTDLNGLTDEQAGKDAVRAAYSPGGQLIVQRGEQQLTLSFSQAPQVVPPPPANTTAQKPPPQQQQQNPSNGGESDTMSDVRQRLHALPTY